MTIAHRLRRADPEDAEPLARCIDAAYAVYRDRIPNLPDVSSGVSESIADRTVWVVEVDGDIVGGMVLDMRGEVALLENIAVHPKRSGMGIGKALLRRAELDALEGGRSELRLSTHRDITENVRLYQHLGWKIVDESGVKVHMSKSVRRTE